MLTEYIRAAMRQATYEILPENGTFSEEIPELDGVWASESTLEACREELQSALEDWISIGLRLGQSPYPRSTERIAGRGSGHHAALSCSAS